jgi:hypothetical protein
VTSADRTFLRNELVGAEVDRALLRAGAALTERPDTIAMVGAGAPADAKAAERVQMPYYRRLGEQ